MKFTGIKLHEISSEVKTAVSLLVAALVGLAGVWGCVLSGLYLGGAVCAGMISTSIICTIWMWTATSMTHDWAVDKFDALGTGLGLSAALAVIATTAAWGISYAAVLSSGLMCGGIIASIVVSAAVLVGATFLVAEALGL